MCNFMALLFFCARVLYVGSVYKCFAHHAPYPPRCVCVCVHLCSYFNESVAAQLLAAARSAIVKPRSSRSICAFVFAREIRIEMMIRKQ